MEGDRECRSVFEELSLKAEARARLAGDLRHLQGLEARQNPG